MEIATSKGALLSLRVFFGLLVLFLYLPIALLAVFSFNAGNSVAIWEGFSWRWYLAAWENEQVQEVSLRSLFIASVAAIVSTVCATMAALATTRTRPFPGLTFIHAKLLLMGTARCCRR